ncbi:hypothetical protein HanPSC8_Chr09g0350571 [Helianthus annuus]|nr:hypothetical protein HanPSC8_Chr09g0350571 [Helianthus annuus]
MSLTLKPILQFPLSPPPHHHHHHRPTTVINLSRWNNPNFLKHTHHKLTQKQHEDHLRLHKRFHSATTITTTPPPPPPPPHHRTNPPAPLLPFPFLHPR